MVIRHHPSEHGNPALCPSMDVRWDFEKVTARANFDGTPLSEIAVSSPQYPYSEFCLGKHEVPGNRTAVVVSTHESEVADENLRNIVPDEAADSSHCARHTRP